MSAINPRFGEAQGLSISYTPTAVLAGGQLVERVTGARKVAAAGAGSLIVAGVARQDVVAARVRASDIIVNQEHGLDVIRGCIVPVTYALAATIGQKLIAAAAGQVTPAGATPDSRTVVGECFDATGTGAVGLALIY